jgi:hypothetical protein
MTTGQIVEAQRMAREWMAKHQQKVSIPQQQNGSPMQLLPPLY